MKHPIDAAGNRVYFSEFEFDINPHLGYNDMLDVVKDEAYHIAVSNLDVEGTEPESDERWELWEEDARRVMNEFEAFYKNELKKQALNNGQ